MPPRTFHRLASTATTAAGKERFVEDFLQAAKSAPPITRKQFLDSNQVQRLSLSLNRPRFFRGLGKEEEEGPRNGTPLAPGYHLAYFTPAALPGDLGPDGTDRSYSPGAPFTRRMWAGGRIDWKKDNPLRIGDEATETTELVSAELKATRAGEDMVVVGVEKTFANAKGPALVDRRDMVFRQQLAGPPPPPPPPPQTIGQHDDALLPSPTTSQKSRDFVQTPVSLFRFSALTFNAHMIHYSRPWCREVEGHRDVVVHGPLNLVHMLDFWRDEQADGDGGIPSSVRYRATAPFYAGERYRALLERGADDVTTSVKLWGHDGKGGVGVGMWGDVVD